MKKKEKNYKKKKKRKENGKWIEVVKLSWKGDSSVQTMPHVVLQ